MFHLLLLACALLPGNLLGQVAPQVIDFWDDTKVQDIYLTVTSSDWDLLRRNYQANTYYQANLSWNGVTATVGIRSRGSGSRSPIKPNLDVNITKYIKNQTFLNLGFFVLKANNQDPSTIHERIAFRLFTRMGLPAPREVPERLFINGTYFGYYNLVEHIDENFLQRNFGESGGYLYEWNAAAIYNFEDLGPDPKAYAAFLDLKTSQSDPDLEWFAGLVSAINNSSDAALIPAVSEYLSPQLYLTHVAIEAVINERDGIVNGVFGMNNFFLYHFQNGKLGQLIVWDKDLSFASLSRDIFDGTSINVLTRRLLAIPEYRKVYLDAVSKATSLLGAADGWGDQKTTREYNQVYAIATKDPNKQCLEDSVLTPCGTLEFQNGIGALHDFFAGRAPSLSDTLTTLGYQTPPASPAVTAANLFGSGGTPQLVAGSLADIAITNLGAGTIADSASALPRTAGYSFISVNGVRTPLAAASNGHVTIQLPWDMESTTASIVGINNGQPGNTLELPVVSLSPVILAMGHTNGHPVSASEPATGGEIVAVFATGLGSTGQYFDPGVRAPLTSRVSVVSPVAASFGTEPATVVFAGLAPGLVGLYQIDVIVPPGVPTGSQQLRLTIGNQITATNVVTK